MAEEKKAPVYRARLGLLQMAVWEDQREVDVNTTRTYHSVTLKRSYKDKSGNWQETTALGADDVSNAIYLLQKSLAFLCQGEVLNK